MSLASLEQNQPNSQPASISSSSKIERLYDRACLLREARRFFDRYGVIEVDCPLLTAEASVDAHIDLIPALYAGKEKCYLHSSPEYGMKRLLAEGIGDIYQLAHVFRDGEYGKRHNPEFMMAEWYRLGIHLEKMIEETVEFICLFLGDLSYQIISYRDVFKRYARIDYFSSTSEELFNFIIQNNLPIYPGLEQEGRDALLNIILGSMIEPQLGQEGLLVLAYYPASQAALAQKRWHGEEPVAERFEVYYRGVELANGYHELVDAKEQRLRLVEANESRLSLGKESLPIDEKFLLALEKGLPECCGVAVGFDRLMMLRHQQEQISEVIAWDWKQA